MNQLTGFLDHLLKSAGATVSGANQTNRGGGIGGATCRRFAAEGAAVAVFDLDIEAAFSGVVGDLMDGDRGAKNPLDHFIEGCSVMAYNGQLQENRHYAYVEGNLCLHLQSCWPLYLEQKRKTGQAVEANGLRALKRLVKENHQRGGYVVEIDKRDHLNDSFPRTLALDLEQAKTHLDIEDFPMNANRAWGGYHRTERYDEN